MGRTKRSYNQEQIDHGLTVLALWAGNTHRAHDELKAQGQPIPQSTLSDWMRAKHAQRYEEIRATQLPKLREKLADQQELVAAKAAEATLKLVERQIEEVDNLKPGEIHAAARNLEVTAGTAIDKANLLRDMPTEIKRVENADQLFKKWKASGLLSVESTAEELDPPLLTEGQQG